MTFQNFALSYPENPQAPDAWWKVAEAYAAMNNPLEAASAFERLKVFHPKSKRAPDALLKSAYYFRMAGALDRTKKVLRTLVQEYPMSETVPEGRLQLGETYLEEGNFDRARSELKRVASKASQGRVRAKALLLIGKTYRQQEKSENAEKAFREVIESYPNTSTYYEASYELGLLQQDIGKYLEAIGSLKRIIADTSSSNPVLKQRALLAIGKSYFKLNDFSNSSAFLDQLLRQSVSPEINLEARQLAASAREEQKDYRGALEHYRAITTDTSRVVDRRTGYVGAASASRILKDYQAAVSYLQNFIKEYPNDPNATAALYVIGEIYENDYSGNDKEQKAITSYHEILSRYPRSSFVDDALFRIGKVQERLKGFEQALKSYDELITRYPASPFIPEAKGRIHWITTFEPTPTTASLNKLANLLASLISSESKGESAFHLGEIYFNDLKDYDAAAKMFNLAIENKVAEPTQARACYYRGRCQQLLSEKNHVPPDSALHAYEEFLKNYPSHPFSGDAAAQIALLRISLGKTDEVLKTAEEFVLKYPGSTLGDVVASAAADSLMSKGQLDRASLAYQQVLGWFPSSPYGEEALYRLGQTMANIGRTDSAVSLYDSYLIKYPNGTFAAKVLAAAVRSKLESGKAQESITLLRHLINDYFYTPQAEQAEFGLADAHAASGQLESAIAQCHANLRTQREKLFGVTNLLDPLYRLGSLYEQKGDKSAAKKYYLAYLDEKQPIPEDVRKSNVLASLSRLYKEEGNLESAVNFVNRAIEISTNRNLKRELANLLFERGDYAGANSQFSDLAKSADSNEERIELEQRLIIGLIHMGNLPDADARAKLFSKTYKDVDEQLAGIEFEKGKRFFEKQDYTTAINTFQRLIKEYDNTKYVPTAHYWIGKIHEATGQNQEALKMYGEILKKFPRAEVLPRVYLALGNVNYRSEKFDTALYYFKKVMDDSSSAQDLLPFAMNNLIEAYKTVGLLDAALQLTRTFVGKFPDDESVQDKKIDIGVLFEKLGYHDQSILHLQNLLEDADADLEGEIRYYIGEAFFGKGDYERAVLEFLKVPYLVTKKGRVDWTANAFYMSGQSYEKMEKYVEAVGMYKQIVDRSGIDQTFKAAALKEIDRVNSLAKKPPKRSGE